jgi:hypothetical protein
MERNGHVDLGRPPMTDIKFPMGARRKVLYVQQGSLSTFLKEEAVPLNKWAVYDENGRYYVEMKVFGQTLFLPTS